jgi:wyosine [tRNA(Phe)-imidazoG37] synthetase (radical SAM superfamily)
MIAFGPVPSRRLGMSLGINMVPQKTCTYSCVYCQIGRTTHMTVERDHWYDTEKVVTAVSEKIQRARSIGVSVNYLTFVPEGEPSLERSLGEQIDGVKRLGVPVAVITNSSMLWKKEVRQAIKEADLVATKVDAVSEGLWNKVSRPHGALKLDVILDGIEQFSCEYGGMLTTETMLVAGVNDTVEAMACTADFIGKIKPHKGIISLPLRPPAERWVRPASEYKLGLAYHLLREREVDTELLMGYEGNQFQSTGDIVNDLLSITAVHPMREDAVEEFLKETGGGKALLDRLVREGRLVENVYGDRKFYLRSLKRR